MCKGCSKLTNKVQEIWYDELNNRLDNPIEKLKPFCVDYWLHIESVERVVKGSDECPRYHDEHIE